MYSRFFTSITQKQVVGEQQLLLLTKIRDVRCSRLAIRVLLFHKTELSEYFIRFSSTTKHITFY